MLRILNGRLPIPFPYKSNLRAPGLHVSPLLLEAAACDAQEVYRQLQTGPGGLTEAEVFRRRQQDGPNAVVAEARYRRLVLLGKAWLNPLVVLLLLLAAVSFLTSDNRAGVVMLIMVLLGVVLRFIQEARADTTAAKLKAMIRVTATVVRDGQARELPLSDLVPGDVVHLSAGDMIPADLRLVSCKDLHIIQASLTGESFPVEKAHCPEDVARRSPCSNCFRMRSNSLWSRLVKVGHL